MKKINFGKQNIVDTNIFTNPEYIKAWAKSLQDACGSTTMNVPPDMGKIKWLMDKFVTDYNEQLGLLEPIREEE
jgi:hypothetical protein|tara:strand:- start:45 stop:266 length:222 start_codon:yes stop_codon:yes gene_type:complete